MAAACVTIMLGMSACKDLTGSQGVGAGVTDPAQFQNPDGAIRLRNGTLAAYQSAYRELIINAGLLTDELQVNTLNTTGSGAQITGILPEGTAFDERILPERTTVCNSNIGCTSYLSLQSMRGSIAYSLGALAAYAPASPTAVRGELFAVDGFVAIQLADLFCSGVPLSTIDFGHDYTYAPSSTTAGVYQYAITRFDSALALSADSARIMNLARVGKARALLALGRYPEAAQAVAGVPDAFTYQVPVQWGAGAAGTTRAPTVLTDQAIVADREGINGLPYRSSRDRRTAAVALDSTFQHLPLYFPVKYSVTGYSQVPLADGIEARLIEAEVSLRGGNASGWLTTLNALRTTGTYSVVDTTYQYDTTTSSSGAVTGVDTTVFIDTLWDAGTGGVVGLGPLQDPVLQPLPSGTSAEQARLDVVFDERAKWLFLTAHRQGDLRRLVRNDRRAESTVYPTGPFFAPGRGVYGSDVNAPIPGDERKNPLFDGCIDRGA